MQANSVHPAGTAQSGDIPAHHRDRASVNEIRPDRNDTSVTMRQQPQACFMYTLKLPAKQSSGLARSPATTGLFPDVFRENCFGNIQGRDRPESPPAFSATARSRQTGHRHSAFPAFGTGNTAGRVIHQHASEPRHDSAAPQQEQRVSPVPSFMTRRETPNRDAHLQPSSPPRGRPSALHDCPQTRHNAQDRPPVSGPRADKCPAPVSGVPRPQS